MRGSWGQGRGVSVGFRDSTPTPTVRPEQQMADPASWGFHAVAGRDQEHPGLAAGTSRACPAAPVAGWVAGSLPIKPLDSQPFEASTAVLSADHFPPELKDYLTWAIYIPT